MGCVGASGARNGSRGQPETTHEVFSGIRSFERVALKAGRNAKAFHSMQGRIVQGLHHR